MIRLIIGLVTVSLLLSSALAVRAERLNAVWIGPDGNGGAGNWSTPANWNLGVVPNNGADGNGDGLPDTFDVQIDGGLPDMSSVLTDTSRTEIANLSIAAGDRFEVSRPTLFVLDDSDGTSEIANDGLLRVGHALSFVGTALLLTGNGTLEVGLVPGQPAGLFPGTPGAHIVNGAEHTIRTSGFRSGRIGGLGVGMSNEGTIVSADRAVLTLNLNHLPSVNRGAVRATTRGNFRVNGNNVGNFRNAALIEANVGEIQLVATRFVNEEVGVVRATDGLSTVAFSSNVEAINEGLIESVDGGQVIIEGKPIVNRGNGVIRASSGGVIALHYGTFTIDSGYQLLDEQSSLSLFKSTYINQGSLLSPGPGILRLWNAHVIGGHLSSGAGRIEIESALLEDIAVSGTASPLESEMRLQLKGIVNVISNFDVLGLVNLTLAGADATLRGNGSSSFGAAYVDAGLHTLTIDADHWAEFQSLRLEGGDLRNNGVVYCDPNSTLIVTGGTLSGVGAVVSRHIRMAGVLSPGTGVGTLSLIGDVHFDTYGDRRGTYLAELGLLDSDLLAITGDMDLATAFDTLSLNGGVLGRDYLIARYTGQREGIFDNVTPGYDVIYDDDAKQIRVQVIPEPASVVLAMAALVGGAAVVIRRRALRKRASSGD